MSAFRKAWTLVSGVNIPRPKAEKSPDDFGLEVRTQEVRIDNDIKLEIWTILRGFPKTFVVMFHGYGGEKSALLPEAKQFVDMGYEVILADFRGHGGSSPSSTSLGYNEAEDVAAVFKHAQRIARGRRIVLFGSSMGAAAIARAVALGLVKPDALILESSYGNMLSTIRNRFHLMGLPAFPFANMLLFWGGLQGGFDGFEHNPAEYAEKIRIPTLLLHGTQDRRVKADEIAAVHKNLKGRKQLVYFPKGEHGHLLQADRERWENSITAFLGKPGVD